MIVIFVGYGESNEGTSVLDERSGVILLESIRMVVHSKTSILGEIGYDQIIKFSIVNFIIISQSFFSNLGFHIGISRCFSSKERIS